MTKEGRTGSKTHLLDRVQAPHELSLLDPADSLSRLDDLTHHRSSGNEACSTHPLRRRPHPLPVEVVDTDRQDLDQHLIAPHSLLERLRVERLEDKVVVSVEPLSARRGGGGEVGG